MMEKVEYKNDNKIINSCMKVGGVVLLTAVVCLNPVLAIPVTMAGAATGIGAGVVNGLASIIRNDYDDDDE